jgi:predicted nucleic acid-binding protein
MRVLFDTSVLVAAVVQPHPVHARAVHWLRRAKSKEFESFVAAHSLAELYAVLTTLPVSPRILPGTAWRIIREDVEAVVQAVSLSPREYGTAIQRMAEWGLSGGIVYDALIAQVAEKVRVQKLLTLNPEDFKRVWPEGGPSLSLP